MKAIILAGGSGTRLYPTTIAISKQMLPIYDKPMIYYPLAVVMLAGVRDILIISTNRDISCFQELLGDGSHLGLKIEYAIQEKPRGLAEAFIIGEKFIGNDSVMLVLGDNIFYGSRLSETLQKASNLKTGALIFGYKVPNPQDYGIVEFDSVGKVLSVEEKPKKPKSDYAIPGLYFYDNKVIEFARQVTPSKRGELEITAVNDLYLQAGDLRVELLGRGTAWLDTGTHDGLLEASNFVAIFQRRQGLYISCVEEIAFRKGYINSEQLRNLANKYLKTSYGKYLIKVASETL
ncbi:glucose-1-phosphate thymidylyltransferase RfbA [Veillonella intestinalis]|uniref:glucose-1-phosphate thymidylyltransferase RfbA n=1 Tax=Veillonella intestinalis TaxID=2941341 RepID=UPI00203A8059|nr:glucose-1-phosphate thymidylyltransferase RfbA [Veillonella intestinalis]